MKELIVPLECFVGASSTPHGNHQRWLGSRHVAWLTGQLTARNMLQRWPRYSGMCRWSTVMTSDQPLLWQLHSWLDNLDPLSLLFCGHVEIYPNSRKIVQYSIKKLRLRTKEDLYYTSRTWIVHSGREVQFSKILNKIQEKVWIFLFRNKMKPGTNLISQWLKGPFLGTEQKTRSCSNVSNSPMSECKKGPRFFFFIRQQIQSEFLWLTMISQCSCTYWYRVIWMFITHWFYKQCRADVQILWARIWNK